MNRLILAGGLLAGIGCASNLNDATLESQQNLPVLNLEDLTQNEGLMGSNEYSLAEDPVRLGALRNFFDDSLDKGVFENKIEDNLVLIKASGYIAHGYLIDDSGLVLTVEHMAQRVNREGVVNGSIIDNDGNVYPARRTEIISENLDYAILVAETGKDPKTHPLKFVDSSKSLCMEDVGFFTYSLFPPYESSIHEGGTVICSEHALEALQNFKGKHLGVSLDDSSKRGFSFISNRINPGDSGSPVFINPTDKNPTFFGLAAETYEHEEGIAVDDFGVVTSSSDILYSLKLYLDNLDSP